MLDTPLFVYGSLRRGSAAKLSRLLARRCRWVGDGTIEALMFDAGGYPAAVPANKPGQRVYGEVYRIPSQAVLRALDTFEGCTSEPDIDDEYHRRLARVRLCDGREVECWVYFYAHSVANLPRIISGDFTCRQRQPRRLFRSRGR